MFPPLLPVSDNHCRRSQIRSLPDKRTAIAHRAHCICQQRIVVLRRKVLVVGISLIRVLLPEDPDPPRYHVTARINIRPHDDLLLCPVSQCVQRLLDLSSALLRRCRDRMLQHQNIRLRKINLLSNITISFHPLIGDGQILMIQRIDGRTAAVHDTPWLFSHPDQPLPALLCRWKMIV